MNEHTIHLHAHIIPCILLAVSQSMHTKKKCFLSKVSYKILFIYNPT